MTALTEPGFADRMERAYQAGREARRLRHGRNTCMHAEGTPAYEQWLAGWREMPVKRTEDA